MKKIVVTVFVAAAIGSSALAAPLPAPAPGQLEAGYGYNSVQTSLGLLGNLGTYHAHEYSAGYGLTDKLSLHGSYLNASPRSFTYGGSVVRDLKFDRTSIGLQYKLTDSLAVLAGNTAGGISSAGGAAADSELYGGLAYRQNLGDKTGSYASYRKGSRSEEWEAGLTYQADSQVALGLGYRSYTNEAAALAAKGWNFSVSHMF